MCFGILCVYILSLCFIRELRFFIYVYYLGVFEGRVYVIIRVFDIDVFFDVSRVRFRRGIGGGL